jgi:hypothetical protein
VGLKSAILLLLLTAVCFSQEDTLRLEVNFDKHWAAYLFAKIGCPIPVKNHVVHYELGECDLPRQIRSDEFVRSCELARQIWNLSGECK